MSQSSLGTEALLELDLRQVLQAVTRWCITDAGRDAVHALVPHSDATQLRTELERVQECVNLIQSNDPLPFDRLADIRMLLRKSRIEGNFLSAPELLNVVEAMQTSRAIRRYLVDHATLLPSLTTLCEPLIDDRMIEKHVTDAIDDTGAVRDNASRELQSIRREIHELETRLRQRLQRILKKFGEEELLQEEFITQRDDRFVLPLRVENKRAVDGIIHGVSQTGSTVFLEPAETYEMNNELSLLRGREKREIIRILTTLTAEISNVSHHIEAAFDVMTHLDTLLARARHATEYGGIRPTIVDEKFLELTNVRHPVLVQHAGSRRATVVPLSVSLDAQTRGILISGPNAGGKTVAMKTIGLSLTMAMSGIFPLGMCTTSLCRIFTAIGDHQSIESNLSTFSSQIIRLRDILSECGDDALVLIDEICAGTDPAEGGALAAGVLDSLLERGAAFVVTTHQSSLKQYALTRSQITNASLEFDEEKLQPTFKFQFGVPGNSYAFDLARNVGLPDVVISRAKGYLGERHDELEESISAMQRFRREAEELKLEAARDRLNAEKLKQDYEERSAQIKEKRKTVVEEAREEARDILRKANALIENTIREIKEQERSAASAKNNFELSKRELLESSTSDSTVDGGPGSNPSGEILSIGDFRIGSAVRISGTASNGEIVAIEGQSVVVLVNGIKFKVSPDQLELVGGKQKQGSKTKTTGSSQSSADARASNDAGSPLTMNQSITLDMRGMRADEGLNNLEHFLDNAIVTNLPFAAIIHGKGTGTLRSVVHAYLKDRPGIKSFRIGTIPEGGDGVTVVEFL